MAGRRKYDVEVTTTTRYEVWADSPDDVEEAALDHDASGDDDNEDVRFLAVLDREAAIVGE